MEFILDNSRDRESPQLPNKDANEIPDQRSFELRPNGGWKCYACGAWGFLVEAREEYLRNMRVDRFYGGKFGRKNGGGTLTPSRPLKARRNENRGQSRGVNKPSAIEPATPNLDEKMARFREALTPGSLAARYLEWRGISLETAKRFGLGYAAYGEWPPATGGTNRVSGPEESEEAPPGHWARREEVDRWLDAAAAIMAEICEVMEETAVSAEKMEEATFEIDPEEAEKCDRKASETGWLILSPGKAYERRLTRNHSVFLFRGPGGWEAIKSKWAPGERTPEKEMTFATGTFDRVMKEAERYIRWFETLPGMRRLEQPTGTKSAATAETTGQRRPEPEQEGKAETADETTQGELFMGF
jgi:hypothetical protein